MSTKIEEKNDIDVSAVTETKAESDVVQDVNIDVDVSNIDATCDTEIKANSEDKPKKTSAEYFVTEMIDKDFYTSGKRGYLFFKRAQDIFFSSLALVALSPLMLVTAICIVIDDPKGGPFFSQIRCGKDGKHFRLYKFRSMCVDAEEKLKSMMHKNESDRNAFKVTLDDRITRVGNFIRKTSIDELPQLINILKGDMSIVGPRPPLPSEVENYTKYDLQRLYVKPGLTCIWQVQRNRNDICFDRWVSHDVKYIKKRSFLLDWKLIFLTIRAVFGGYGK